VPVTAAILRVMVPKSGRARAIYEVAGRCAAWVALIAVLLLTVPSAVAMCGGRTMASHADRQCPCCDSPAKVPSRASTCGCVRTQPALPLVPRTAPSGAQMVLAAIDMRTAPAFDRLRVYEVRQTVRPKAPSRLLSPILRI
jgi:hypothetical protein